MKYIQKISITPNDQGAQITYSNMRPYTTNKLELCTSISNVIKHFTAKVVRKNLIGDILATRFQNELFSIQNFLENKPE